MGKAKRKNRSGALFIIILLTLICLLIYSYRDKLQLLLKLNFNESKNFITKTFDKMKNKKETKETSKNEKIENKDNEKNKEIEKKIETIEVKNKLSEINKDNITAKEKKKITPTEEIKSKNTTEKIVQKNIDEKEISKRNQTQSVLEKEAKKTTIKKIYFSKVTEKGDIELVPVDRKIEYINTPLTETIRALINGPTESEKTRGIITNIPAGTKLLSVVIKDSIAYINLSKEFQANYSGKESMSNQIKQIVYTATEYPNVKSVQILIESKVQMYLGGEGIVINKPLTRNDF